MLNVTSRVTQHQQRNEHMFFKIEKAEYELSEGRCTSVTLNIFLESGTLKVPAGKNKGNPEIIPCLLVCTAEHEDQALDRLSRQVDAMRQGLVVALGWKHDNVKKCTELIDMLKEQSRTLWLERTEKYEDVATRPTL